MSARSAAQHLDDDPETRPTGMPPERSAPMATITPYADGPLLVRGAFRLVDQDGNEVAVERSTVALCRCGMSARKPFCDGSHKLTGFSAPSGRDPLP